MVFLLSSGTTAATESLMPLLILGDSLSAAYGIPIPSSWPRLLATRIRESGYKYSVVNASISGETTAGGARRVELLMAEHAPGVVFIALGANDGLRGTDPGETETNLKAIVGTAKKHGAEVVLMKVRLPPNYGPQYLAAFEAIFERVAGAEQVALAPFMLESLASESQAFQPDGLHPVAEVQPMILDELWPSLKDAMERAQRTHVE